MQTPIARIHNWLAVLQDGSALAALLPDLKVVEADSFRAGQPWPAPLLLAWNSHATVS
ncbi:hypothetical protein [Lichenicoccus sp.]|uniref:hypothetical protein n=1 Tax=Lichenicoccus sp. TaxID=2781899 RepID=UPI003D1169ED